MRRLWSILLTLALILALVPSAAMAAEAQDLTQGSYTYRVESGTAVITGYTGAGGSAAIPGTLGGYPVGRIGKGAFENCTGLTAVSIPGSVTAVEDDAFHNCTGLRMASLGAGVKTIGDFAFAGCTALTAASIPDGVTAIGLYAFYGCRAMRTLTLPDTVTTIGEGAFTECVGLTGVTVPAGKLGDWAFGGCTGLTEVTLGRVSAIGQMGFFGCEALKKIIFLTTAPTIGEAAFGGVTAAAFYPVGDDSWTTAVRQSYGGKLTWSPPERMAGATRQATAVEISRAAFPNGSDSVILASGDNYPDALAGGPLAFALDAPVLLIQGSRPDQDTLNEIRRLGAGTAYILGGSGVISDGVAGTLEGMGLTVERLAGADRFATAAAIARKLEEIRGARPDTVFFVYSYNYPDALAVTTVAALLGAPILFVEGSGVLRDTTAGYLDHLGSVKKSYILGGPAVIASKAETILGAYGPVQRLYGATRYDTCLLVDRTFADLLRGSAVCLACGNNYPDALAGSVFAAKCRAPLVLARSSLTAEQTAFIQQRASRSVYAFGGSGVLGEAVLTQARRALS